jgi:transmembrane sensor
MSLFKKIVILSKQIAASFLKDEDSIYLEKTELFNKEDKEYIISELKDETQIKERLAFISNIDKKKDWNKVNNKIEVPIKKRYWHYAAAASVIGILTFSYLLRDTLLTAPIESIEPVIVNAIIEKGTDKAILTLEDGSQIDLEKGVSIQTNNANSNGEQIVYDEANVKTRKIVYNYLTIPRGGQFFIKLADGTQIWLNSESQLKYPVNFKENETRVVELIYGEAYFDVSPSTDHNGAGFKVYNNKQEVHVLGTEFNIKAYKDEANIYTTLVEGSVMLDYNGEGLQLIPNQQSDVNLENKTMSSKTVDIYNEISWKEGVFSFDGKSLKDIMKVLSRWYDMEVEYKNRIVQDEEFNGVLGKEQDINEILNSIKNFGIIKDFKIMGKKIVLE